MCFTLFLPAYWAVFGGVFTCKYYPEYCPAMGLCEPAKTAAGRAFLRYCTPRVTAAQRCVLPSHAARNVTPAVGPCSRRRAPLTARMTAVTAAFLFLFPLTIFPHAALQCNAAWPHWLSPKSSPATIATMMRALGGLARSSHDALLMASDAFIRRSITMAGSRYRRMTRQSSASHD